MTTQQTRPSLDDPRIAIPSTSEWYEPAPTAQTERQAEFLNLRDGEMFINMGPQHPSTHGVLRIVVKVNGVVVPPGPNTWTFDAASNSIKFNSTATPQPGVPLEIEYTQSCF